MNNELSSNLIILKNNTVRRFSSGATRTHLMIRLHAMMACDLVTKGPKTAYLHPNQLVHHGAGEEKERVALKPK